MWDLPVANPLGRLSMRKFLISFFATILAIFSLSSLLVQPAGAVDATSEATWRGSAIVYDENQYVEQDPVSSDSSIDLPDGTIMYVFIESIDMGNDGRAESQIAHVIYFPPGTDLTDATSANYAQYDFVPPDTYTNPSSQSSISIDAQDAASQEATSCDSTFTFGLGWIICPVTNFLAGAMDWLFDILASFLVVRPAQTNQENALYRAWSMMRSFANVAFVLAFIILIYSQLTNIGLTNYGIKKMLPRLVVAAVLVNISYWVCAIAIDISNILGYSVQDIFIGIRNNLIAGEGNSWDLMSWQSVGSFILSGGTAALAGGLAFKALLAGTVGGALYLLLPILVGVLMAVLVALLVLAIRQALITALVIIAPLAFVAFLLPNTEKYFDKWRSLFMTMLLVFPMFSIIFGGSQLAGLAIIQNANSINMVILGMAVQVAPVAITPMLIQLSGSLIGRIAGMVNNPNRGMIDRTRQWSQDRANQHKERVFGNSAPRGLNRVSQNMEMKRRKRESWLRANQTRSENVLRQTEGYQAIDTATREADRVKQTIDSQLETTWNVKARIDPKSLEKELKLRVSADEASLAKSRLETVYDEIKAGDRSNITYGPQSGGMTDLLNRAQDAQSFVALEAMRKKAAQRVQENNIGDILLRDSSATTDLFDGKSARDYAGGIRGVEGANTALTQAIATDRREFNEMVGEKQQLMKHFELSSDQYQRLALGNNVSVSKGGIDYMFTSDDHYNREAAIETQMKAGSESHIREVISQSGASIHAKGEALTDKHGKVMKDANGQVIRKGKTYDYHSTIQDALVSNGIPSKQLIFGSKIIDDIGQGRLYGEQGLNDAAVFHIMQGKVSDDVLARQGSNTLKTMFETYAKRHSIDEYTKASAADQQKFEKNYQALLHSAHDILADEVNRNYSQASKEVFEAYKVRRPASQSPPAGPSTNLGP